MAEIRTMISTKPYAKHVVDRYFAIDTHRPDAVDYEQVCLNYLEINVYQLILIQIDQLKQIIEEVTLNESYIGEQIPTRWLEFESDLNRLKKHQENFYASLDQICEIARTQNICSSDELKTLLDFYHDLGVIVYFGNSQDMFLKNTLILRPHKLIELIKKFVSNPSADNQTDDGILDERTFEQLCQPFIEQKQIFLALLKKFDLLCEKYSPANTTLCKQYYVPSCIRKNSMEKYTTDKDDQSVVFYYLFDGYLPGKTKKNNLRMFSVKFISLFDFVESLFHQILVRTIKWTQTNHGSSPKLSYRRGKFLLDDQHILILTASSMKYARMKVQILRMNSNTNTNNSPSSTTNQTKTQDENNTQLADPNLVAKIRKFLESLLNELKSTWIRRLAFQCMIVCPCGKMCDLHKTPYCTNNTCLHFLNLDHCLSNPVRI